MKKLITTLAYGENHEKLSEVTKPEMLRYARRIGAKLSVISAKGWPADVISPPWIKLIGLYDALKEWDRVLFLDADTLVNADKCPDLFELVPETHVGAFQEGSICPRGRSLAQALKFHRIRTNRNYDGQYFNTGVMVLSKRHRDLFYWPTCIQDNYYEQSLINARVFAYNVPYFSLDYKFNRMSVLDRLTGEERWGSHIIHYAGSNDFEKLIPAIQRDLERFKNNTPALTHIVVSLNGGLGDAVYAEPVLRHMIENVYGKYKETTRFHIVCHYPRVLAHFKYDNVSVYENRAEVTYASEHMPYYEVATHPESGHVMRKFLPYQAVHNIDFCAIGVLRNSMPVAAKEVQLLVTNEDRAELHKAAGTNHFRDCVLIHPGIGWPSKTFPADYWNKIIAGISSHGYRVVLIGKSMHDDKGVIDVSCKLTTIDLRNKLSLGGLFAAVEACPKLLTNESSPLCIAGAFDNWIYLIETAKRAELLFPFRRGRVDYKTRAILKRHTSDDLDIRPTNIKPYSIAEMRGNIEDCLTDPEEVVRIVTENR